MDICGITKKSKMARIQHGTLSGTDMTTIAEDLEKWIAQYQDENRLANEMALAFMDIAVKECGDLTKLEQEVNRAMEILHAFGGWLSIVRVLHADEVSQVTSSNRWSVRRVLQMAVDYYTLSSGDYENKYPWEEAEKPDEPGWVARARRVLAGETR